MNQRSTGQKDISETTQEVQAKKEKVVHRENV